MTDEIKKDTVDYRDPTPFDDSKLQSISEISKAIRHKQNGQDVREPIAQQGEALVKLMQDAGGNQSAEVVAARGNHELLPMREDAQDEAIVKAQSTADSKFDANQAESYLKSVTAIPETFANLSAIKAKYPSGANGLMVAADNGHKYIWSNNAWTDAGIYQSVGLADQSISSSKLALNASNVYLYPLGRLPNINTEDNRIEIYSNFNIMYSGSIYKTFTFDSFPVYISISGNGFICINPETGAITLEKPPINNDKIVLGGLLYGNTWLNAPHTVNGHTENPKDSKYALAPSANLFNSRGNDSMVSWNLDERSVSIRGMYINYGNYSRYVTDSDIIYDDSSTQFIYYNFDQNTIEIEAPPITLGQSRIMIGWLSHSQRRIYLPTLSDYIKIIPDPSKTTDPVPYLTSFNDMIAIGDSITYGLHATNPKTGSWPAIIAKNTGVAIYNEGISSATWQTGSNNDEISLVERAKEIDLTRANNVVLFAGTNDFAQDLPIGAIDDISTNTMLGAINNTLETIYSKNAKANIYLITPMWRARINGSNVDIETTPNKAGLYLREYVNAIKQVGEKYHLPTLDLYHEFNINALNSTTWLADGLHPNDTGYDKLAEKIAKFVMING